MALKNKIRRKSEIYDKPESKHVPRRKCHFQQFRRLWNNKLHLGECVCTAHHAKIVEFLHTWIALQVNVKPNWSENYSSAPIILCLHGTTAALQSIIKILLWFPIDTHTHARSRGRLFVFIILIHLFIICCCCCFLLKLFAVKVNKLHTGYDLQLRYTNSLFVFVLALFFKRRHFWESNASRYENRSIWNVTLWNDGNSFHETNAQCIILAYFAVTSMFALFNCTIKKAACRDLIYASGSNLSFRENENDLWQL